MRIVHFLERLPCGGLGTVVDLLHRGALAQGHESHVISGSRAETWKDWLPLAHDWTEDLGLPVEKTVFWKWRYRRRLGAALQDHLRKWRPDVVHVHQIPTLIRVAPVLRRLRLPCLLTIHGMVPTYAGEGIRRFFIRCAFRRALSLSRCRGVAVSPSSARFVEQGLGLPPGRIGVQHNPLDADRFSGSGRSGPAPRIVLMISRLIWQKRVQDGVRALALLDDQPEFRLRITGGGPMRKPLEALADDLGVTPRVDFLGVRRDIPDLLREAGVLWHLSKLEGGPMTILEAMASDVPVVVTDVPGSGELVRNGVNGLVVPLNSPHAVAEATRQLWSDDALRCRVIEGGRATVAEHRMERVVADYVRRYQQAIAEYG